MGSLPLPPVPPNFSQPSGPGPFQGYNAPQNQLQSAPPSTGANLLQGIAAFLEQYKKGKETERQEAMGRAQQNIQNMLLGLPVDKAKTAALMKKAGLDIDFESTTSFSGPPQPQTHETQPMGGGQGTPPVPGGSVTTNLGPSPQQSAPPPPQGFWDRVKQQFLGQGGQISPTSPGMEALGRIHQRGQQNQRIDQGKANLEERALPIAAGAQNVESQKQALVLAALSGNPQATELATKAGIFQDLKGDEIFRMGHAAGMTDEQIGKGFMSAQFGNTKMLEMQLSMADGMKKYFGNDLSKAMRYVNDVFTEGRSQLQPEAVGIDDRIKMIQASIDLQKQYPTAPINLTNAYATAKIAGDDKTASTLLNVIAEKFPTSGDLEWTKWTAGRELDLKKFGQVVSSFNKEYELNVMKAVKEAMGEQFQQAWKLIENKTGTTEEQNLGRAMIADAMNKLGKLTVKAPSGGTITLGPGDLATRAQKGWFFDKENRELTTTSSSGDILQTLQGMIQPPASVGPGEQKNWREEMRKRLSELNLLGSPEASGQATFMIPDTPLPPAPTPGVPPGTFR